MTKLDKETELPAFIAGVAAVFVLPIFVVIIFIVTLPFNLFEAWVLQQTYNWFIVPIGAPSFSYWHFVGITLFLSVVQIFFLKTGAKDSRKFKDIAMGVFGKFMALGAILLLAFLVKGWM